MALLLLLLSNPPQFRMRAITPKDGASCDSFKAGSGKEGGVGRVGRHGDITRCSALVQDTHTAQQRIRSIQRVVYGGGGLSLPPWLVRPRDTALDQEL